MKIFTKYLNLKSVALVLSLAFFTAYNTYAVKDSYPNAITTQPANASYCLNAAATALSVNTSNTTCGSGGIAILSRTFTWYQTSTSCSGGTVVKTITNTSTSDTYTPPTTSAGTLYYYCVISWGVGPNCAPSGSLTSNCATITIVTLPNIACYCTSNASTTTYSFISNVTFNTINNASSGCTNYTNFTGTSTAVTIGNSYDLTITKDNCTNPPTQYTGRFRAWIDWNIDGDFDDAGELVLTDGAASNGPITASVTVPSVTPGTTIMRCIVREGATAPPNCGSYTTWGETEDYTVTIEAAGNMAYSSSTVAQASVANVTAGSTNMEILRIEVVTTGTTSPISATDFTLNTSGSTNASNDIATARLYYTGTSSTFSTTTQAGSDIANPNGGFSINAATTLAQGTNYFWLAYDIRSTATTTNVVDGTCTIVRVDGVNRTPTVTNPAGSRPIADPSYCNVTGNSNTTGWVSGVQFNAISRSSGWDGGYYNGTGTSTDVCKGSSYDLTVTRWNDAAYRQYTAGWIDFNRDGDFTDAGENVMLADNWNATVGDIGRTVSVTIPVGAATGTVRLRVLQWYSGAGPNPPANTGCDITGDACCNFEYEDYTINILSDNNMTYTSSTVTQASVATVTQGSTGNEILRIEIVTGGGCGNPLSATSFSLNTTGSTNPSGDITQARLYYTGASSTFSLTNQVGEVMFDPNGSFSSTGVSQVLSYGTSYFWLTYNIDPAATATNVVDAQCTSINVGGARVPSVTNPAGSRGIVALSPGAYCAVTGTGTNNYLTNVSFNSINNSTLGDCSGTSNYCDYTSTSTTVYYGMSYELVVDAYSNTKSAGLWYAASSAYIDWNRDGDFGDAGETVLTGVSGAQGSIWNPYRIAGDILIPSNVVLGTTRLRVVTWFSTSTAPAACGALANAEIEDYSIIIGELAPMTYVSCTSTQNNISSVNAGSATNEILGIEVVTSSGTVNPLNVSSFTVPTTGTSTLGDIANAKLWYSGTDPSFGTTTQLGSTVVAPGATLTFSGFTQTLSSGTNYFWVTYDVLCAASGAQIDAGCTSVIVSGSAKTPATTAPGGNRAITPSTAMVYVSTTCTQNNSNVAKGETNQHIIGIEIVVTGCSSPMSTGDFALCNSSTVAGDVTNAKLFYTGTSGTFATTAQVGSTVAAPTACAATYTITTTQALSSGTNYFWLTYDISGSAACDPNGADARCSTVVVGGVSRTPTLINPGGVRYINCGTPYYSKGNLNVNTLSSWSTTRDGSGAAPASFNSAYDFYVQSGHSMTASAAVTIPNVYMEYNSRITTAYLITMTTLMINNGAVFEQTAKASTASYITEFWIKNGGTWIHNNNGYLPGVNRYFEAASNQWFYQWGGGTFPSGTAWGNVLFNGTTTGNFNLSLVMNTIQGNWEWRRIGNSNYLVSGSTETIDVGGDLIFTGGWFKGMAGAPGGAKTLTFNVTGDLSISSGTFNDFSDGNSGNKTVLTVGGNVTVSGGTWSYNNCPDGLSQINLDGGTPSITWAQTGGTVTLCNTNIKNLKTVTLAGSQMGSFAASRTLTLETGGTLMCSNYPVTGAGAFTMQDNSILGIGSAAGIVATGASGNVQVSGTRTYHSGGHYIYYEGLTPQVTGSFTTSPTASTVRKLRIQKSTISDIVNLSANLSVSDSTVLIRGELGLNQKTLTITRSANDGIKRTDGYIKSEHNAAVNLSVVTWNFGATNASYIIPFGVSSAGDGYIPLTFNKTAGTSNVSFATRVTLSNLNTPWAGVSNVAAVANMFRFGVDSSTTSVVDRWWDITASAATTADVTFTYRGVENTLPAANPNYRTGTLAAQHWNGTNWELKVGTGTGVASGTGTVAVTGSTTFSPWIIVASPAPLPIELLSFTAKVEGDFVLLEWATASEKNTSHFIVKKGTNPANLEQEVVKVKAAGNSNQITSYFELDKNPNPGINYYQLTMIDNNGDVERHKIVDVFFTKSFRVNSILPNPVLHQANVSVYNPDESMNVIIEVVNSTGEVAVQKIIKINKGNNNIPVDLSNYNKGLYFIKVIPRNYPVEIKKFIKQ